MGAVAKFLLTKDLNAAIVALGCMLLTLVGFPGAFLAAIIVAYVTMQKGYKSGAFVLAFVALPALAFLFHGEVTLLDVMLLRCVFVWVLAYILFKYRSWQLALEVLMLSGIAIVLLCHLFMGNLEQFWYHLAQAMVKQVSTVWRENINTVNMQAFMHVFMHYATGIFVFIGMLGVLFEILLARLWIYRGAGKVGALTQEFSRIRIGRLSAVIFVIVALGSALHVPLMRDCLFVVLFPFVVGGLSYLHYVTKQRRHMVFVLFACYVGLCFLPIVAALALSIVGFVDSWCDFRKRFAYQ